MKLLLAATAAASALSLSAADAQTGPAPYPGNGYDQGYGAAPGYGQGGSYGPAQAQDPDSYADAQDEADQDSMPDQAYGAPGNQPPYGPGDGDQDDERYAPGSASPGYDSQGYGSQGYGAPPSGYSRQGDRRSRAYIDPREANGGLAPGRRPGQLVSPDADTGAVPADIEQREAGLERRIGVIAQSGMRAPYETDNLMVQLDSIRAQQEELAQRDNGLNYTDRRFIEARLQGLEGQLARLRSE